ncbi:glycoside hydrolase family 99-like domain-containing protein [Desertimonas flava]|uniref:glycoside hydrolase family 99-like domain-containing protein n=1 Tax=Desertimonas flava TaxID=2064846 RepID=UPI000E355415|nr:glycoside hydrolase family 99-like domain-containing protein [Desertimonas flava]
MSTERPIQVIAFFLPQMHPVPENDAWWGEGFTEWTKVASAQPLGPTHYQPHLPGALGFYDLRVPEVRERQAALARRHGIDGFMYYHYWFGGHRLIDRTVDEIRVSGRPDLPFCLCWANENWTRAWDAGQKSILMEQRYDAEERAAHVEWLAETFADPRYIHVDGRPLFAVYRPQVLEEMSDFVEQLRNAARARGVADPYLVKFDTHGNFDPPQTYGFDAAAQFLPHGVSEWVPFAPTPPGWQPNHLYMNYEDVVNRFIDHVQPPWTRHECVMPSWDNTPRRRSQGALVMLGSSPDRYERWLRAVYERAPERGGVVFINAWNEWAEGAHLEPDQMWGDANLRATARVVLGAEPSDAPDDGDPPHPLAEAAQGRYEELYLDVYDRYVRARRRLTSFDEVVRREVDRRCENLSKELREERARVEQLSAQLKRLLSHRPSQVEIG